MAAHRRGHWGSGHPTRFCERGEATRGRPSRTLRVGRARPHWARDHPIGVSEWGGPAPTGLVSTPLGFPIGVVLFPTGVCKTPHWGKKHPTRVCKTPQWEKKHPTGVCKTPQWGKKTPQWGIKTPQWGPDQPSGVFCRPETQWGCWFVLLCQPPAELPAVIRDV